MVKKNIKKDQSKYNNTTSPCSTYYMASLGIIPTVVPTKSWTKGYKNTSVSFINLVKDNWQNLSLLCLLVIIVYANSVRGGFVSDDIPIISESKTIGTLGGILAKPYVFMRDFLYFIIYSLFGANPVIYHLLNISFHAGSVSVLFLILKMLFNKRIAIFASVLFAVHPIITESVSWISGGGYPQYSFFILLSFLLFIMSREVPPQFVWQSQTSRGKPERLYNIWSIIFFILALLSSDKALVYPAIVSLFLISSSDFVKHWKKIIPFVMLSLIWSSFYYFQFTDRVQSHTLSFGDTAYITNPFLLSATAITTYLKLIFWPDDLTIYHSEFTLNPFDTIIIVSVFIIFITTVGISYVKNRAVFFWLMLFVVSLGVTLLPLRVSWIVAERYVYLGSTGIFVVTGLFFNYLLERKKHARIIYTIFIAIVCILMLRTIVRNTDWATEERLWTSTVQSTPTNPVAHSSLGVVYKKRGDLERAGYEFHQSVSLNPNYAEGYYYLGDVYRLANKLDTAVMYYQKSVVLNPALWQGYQAIGAVYYLQRKIPLAILNTEKAIVLQKNNAELYMNVGIMYYESGDKAAAAGAFKSALRINPDNIQAQSALQKVMNGL